MSMNGGGCGFEGVLSSRDYEIEDAWFCDDAAALTGLKYGWAIASFAVSRSWMQS